MNKRENFNINQKKRKNFHDPKDLNRTNGFNSSIKGNYTENFAATSKIDIKSSTINSPNYIALQPDIKISEPNIFSSTASTKANLDFKIRKNHHLDAQGFNENPVRPAKGRSNEIMQKKFQNKEPPIENKNIFTPKINHKRLEEEKKDSKDSPHNLISENKKNNLELNKKRKNCEACYEYTDQTYKTPRCTKHEFCERCIKSKTGYRHCEYCQMYFESLSREKNLKTYQCALCKLSPSYSEIKCKFHAYCKYCSEFLLANEYSHILNVANCEECNSSLQNIKGKNIARPEITSNITINETESNKFVDKPEPLHLHQNYELSTKSTNLFNLENYSNASPEMDTNSSLTSNPHKQYPDLILNPILEISFTENSINRLLTNEIKLSKNCCFCASQDKIKRFLCYHSMCIECLVHLCLYQINNFFIKYYDGMIDINYKFTYECTIEECKKSISVPTHMVFKYLNKFLIDPFKREKFEYYSYLVANGFLLNWIEYFDGFSYI